MSQIRYILELFIKVTLSTVKFSIAAVSFHHSELVYLFLMCFNVYFNEMFLGDR